MRNNIFQKTLKFFYREGSKNIYNWKPLENKIGRAREVKEGVLIWIPGISMPDEWK